MDLSNFTDDDLNKELNRRKKERLEQKRRERDERAIFLTDWSQSLLDIVGCPDKPWYDEELHGAVLEGSRRCWDSDYDVEIRLVKLPPLE